MQSFSARGFFPCQSSPSYPEGDLRGLGLGPSNSSLLAQETMVSRASDPPIEPSGPPVSLPPLSDLVIQPLSEILHPQPLPLHLTAWLLSMKQPGFQASLRELPHLQLTVLEGLFGRFIFPASVLPLNGVMSRWKMVKRLLLVSLLSSLCLLLTRVHVAPFALLGAKVLSLLPFTLFFFGLLVYVSNSPFLLKRPFGSHLELALSFGCIG